MFAPGWTRRFCKRVSSSITLSITARHASRGVWRRPGQPAHVLYFSSAADGTGTYLLSHAADAHLSLSRAARCGVSFTPGLIRQPALGTERPTVGSNCRALRGPRGI